VRQTCACFISLGNFPLIWYFLAVFTSIPPANAAFVMLFPLFMASIDTVEKPLISFLKNTVGVPDFYGKPTDIKDNYCITPEIRRKNN
jgi:hypothetical protein